MYLLKGYAVNHWVERLERRVESVEEKVDFFVRTALPPVKLVKMGQSPLASQTRTEPYLGTIMS
jgi:hypothetical protein